MSDRYESGSNKRASEDGHDMDNEEERPSKPPRSDLHIDLRMLLPSKAAGAVIGKGGQNIKRLRTDYKASISVPDSRGPERILSISGKANVVCAIMMDVIPTISQEVNPSNCHEVRLLIHEGFIGRLIGVGGAHIKTLREETGSQINIFERCAPLSTERVVQINGSAQQITDCIGEVYETMEGAKPSGQFRPYDPRDCLTEFIKLYGGYSDSSDTVKTSLVGATGGMSSSMVSRSGETTDRVTTSQVSIPKALAGSILGKGGKRIKQVQGESGTKIKLSSVSTNSAERIISITGTQEQIQHAKSLLQLL